MANQNMTYLAVIGMVVLFVVGFLGGAVIHPGTTTTNNSSEPFHLTLVITDNNIFNSTVGSQPAFFVLENGVLMSSASIHVPHNKTIELTIMNYDDGADNMTAYNNVLTGNGNNTMLVVKDDVSLAHQGPGEEINMTPQIVSSVPLNDISHTFTIEDAKYNPIVNIPIEPSSTISTTITLPASGSSGFHWQCFVPCGSGTSGWEGAMSTPGWMEGTVFSS